MASLNLSGTLTRSGYQVNSFPWTCSVSETANTSANTSTLSFTATIQCNTSSTAWDVSNAPTLVVTWHDNVANTNTTVASASYGKMPANTTKTITGTLTVSHANDGTASGYVTATWTKNTSANSVPGDGVLGGSSAGAMTLTAIPRVPTLTLSASSVAFNTSTADLTATFTGAASIYYTVTASIGGRSVTINNGNVSGAGAKSVTIGKSQILYQMPNSASGTLTVTLTAYSNSARTVSIGSTSKTCAVTITLTGSTGYRPSISITEALGVSTNGLSGNLIAGKSTAQLKALTTAAAGAGTTTTTATITTTTSGLKPKMSVASSTSLSAVTYTTAVLPSYTSNYTIKVTLTATDSRGATSTSVSSSNVTVYGYGAPTPNLTAYRCKSTSDTTPDVGGSALYIAYSASTNYSVNGSNSAYVVSCTYTIGSGSAQTCSTSPTIVTLASTSTAKVTLNVRDDVIINIGGTNVPASANIPSINYPLQLYSSDDGSAVGCGIGSTATSGLLKVGFTAYIGGGKATYNDGVAGIGLISNGNLTQTNATTSNISHSFYYNGATNATARISASTLLYFYTGSDMNDSAMYLTAGKTLIVKTHIYSGGRTSYNDTEHAGVEIGSNGNIYLGTITSDRPSVNFYVNKATTATASITAYEGDTAYGSTSGAGNPRLQVAGALNASKGIFWNGHRAVMDYETGSTGHVIQLRWNSPNLEVYVDGTKVKTL